MNEAWQEEEGFERLLEDCETPYTDFRVEDSDGQPRAVFDHIPLEQSSLLSCFLYPDKNFIGSLYLDVLKVARKEVSSMSYEDDFYIATFKQDSIVIDSKEPVAPIDSHVRVKIPLGDAKLLLLKWKFQCMKWEAIHTQ